MPTKRSAARVLTSDLERDSRVADRIMRAHPWFDLQNTCNALERAVKRISLWGATVETVGLEPLPERTLERVRSLLTEAHQQRDTLRRHDVDYVLPIMYALRRVDRAHLPTD